MTQFSKYVIYVTD